VNEAKLEQDPRWTASEIQPGVVIDAFWLRSWWWLWWVDNQLVDLGSHNSPEDNGDDDVETHRNFTREHGC